MRHERQNERSKSDSTDIQMTTNKNAKFTGDGDWTDAEEGHCNNVHCSCGGPTVEMIARDSASVTFASVQRDAPAIWKAWYDRAGVAAPPMPDDFPEKYRAALPPNPVANPSSRLSGTPPA
jgi:hypothetical protein